MSINNNNTKLTDIFGDFFEPGADIATEAVPSKPIVEKLSGKTFSSLSMFRGMLKMNNGTYQLAIKDGGVFNLHLSETPRDIKDHVDETVVVKGLQNGGDVDKAIISFNMPVGRKPAGKPVTIHKEIKKLADAANSFLARFHDVPGLLTVRPGYKFVNGLIQNIPAIVAVVDRKVHIASLTTSEKLPVNYEGYDVEVVPASPADLIKNLNEYKNESSSIADRSDTFSPTFLEALISGQEEAAELEAAKLGNGYIPPTNVSLDEVTGAMTLLCNVSPEGGWESLKPFIDATTDNLEVAMYDFSAPGIFKALKELLKRGAGLSMVYDGMPAAGVGDGGEGSKKDDLEEDTIITGLEKAGKQNFKSIQAWKGPGGICYNAYHIKVAVRDDSSFWLSSGNWQSSNQPDKNFQTDNSLLKDYNREWNVIIDNNKLSSIYKKFIQWDFERSGEKPEAELIETILLPEMFVPEEELETGQIAKFKLFEPQSFVFTKSKPVRIQPVLSPDNYLDFAMQIINSAKNTLYFQNQYIKIGATTTSEYDELLKALKKKINDLPDGRIILRSLFSADDRKMLESLKARDFDMSRVKMMKNTHTKGIIADGERILIGSHNWSNAGVQFNRDASLLIYDSIVAQYYQDVFLHDWDRRATASVKEEAVLISDSMTEAALIEDGLVKLDWLEYFS